MSDNKPKATRQAFGEALLALGSEFPEIVVLDADLSASTKSGMFGKEYPSRFFQMGIAEQNMIGTAAGLSFTGKIPFACSFGCFLTGRYETIRVSVGYSEANVKLVGTHAGVGIGEDGFTQMGLEDVAIMRALPGMTILQPSDEATTKAAIRFAVEHRGPVYLRLTRQNLPPLYKDEKSFQCGRGNILKEGGNKLALIGTGATVTECLTASEELSELNPWVIDIHTIKPIDRPLIKTLSESCENIVTVEDHSIVGGLGTAVAEVIAESGGKAKLHRHGIMDVYAESGTPEDMYEKYELSGAKIAAKVKRLLKL